MAINGLSQLVHITNASDISGGGDSEGVLGAAIPASATLIGGETPGGLLAAVQINAAGELVVAGGGDAEGTPGAALPSKTIAIGGSDGANLQTLLTGAGNAGSAVLRVVNASDDTLLSAISETQIERYLEIERCTATADWVAIGDASGIATTVQHLPHEDKTGSLVYAKAGGTSVISGYGKVLSSPVDASSFEGDTLLGWNIYLSSLTNVDYALLRLGTDASNYHEWRIAVANLKAGWNRLQIEAHMAEYPQTGTGADFSAISYIGIGIATGAAGDLLAGIIIDYAQILSLPNVATAANLTVNPGNVANAVRVSTFGTPSNAAATTNNGVVSSGTLRITIASDSTGQIYTRPKYTGPTTILTAAADNGVPSGTNGTALAADTQSAYFSVVAAAGVTNADINVWARERGTDVWFIVPGATLVDLQDETGDRWGRDFANIGRWATRVYCELDNYAGAGNVTAYLTESTK